MSKGEFFSGPVKNPKPEKLRAARGALFTVLGREIMGCAEDSGSSDESPWGLQVRGIHQERTRPQNVMIRPVPILLCRLGSQAEHLLGPYPAACKAIKASARVYPEFTCGLPP
jgi:hypothetical protein